MSVLADDLLKFAQTKDEATGEYDDMIKHNIYGTTK